VHVASAGDAAIIVKPMVRAAPASRRARFESIISYYSLFPCSTEQDATS